MCARPRTLSSPSSAVSITRRWISSRGSGSPSYVAASDCRISSCSRMQRTLLSPRLFMCSRRPGLGPVVPTIHASSNSGACASARNPLTASCVIALPSRRALHWIATRRLPLASWPTRSISTSSGELSGKIVVRSGHSAHWWMESRFQCLMAGPRVRTSVSNQTPSPLSSACASISLSAWRASSVMVASVLWACGSWASGLRGGWSERGRYRRAILSGTPWTDRSGAPTECTTSDAGETPQKAAGDLRTASAMPKRCRHGRPRDLRGVAVHPRRRRYRRMLLCGTRGTNP